MSLTRTITRPAVDFSIDALQLEERTAFVHCRLTIPCLLRIAPQTWLVQEDGRRRPLVAAYGIVQAPSWEFVQPDHCFTLVFEGLSVSCRHFDLVEDVEETFPFHFPAIARNSSDVYHLEYPNFPL